MFENIGANVSDKKVMTRDMKQPVKKRLEVRYPTRSAPFAYRVGPDGLVQKVQA